MGGFVVDVVVDVVAVAVRVDDVVVLVDASATFRCTVGFLIEYFRFLVDKLMSKH